MATRPIDISAWLSQIPAAARIGNDRGPRQNHAKRSPYYESFKSNACKRRAPLVSPPTSDSFPSACTQDDAPASTSAGAGAGADMPDRRPQTPSHKRQKTSHTLDDRRDSLQDVDATPTQGIIYPNILPPPSTSSQLPSETSENASNTNTSASYRSSSPTKKLAKLAIDEKEPLETRPLTRPDSLPTGPLLELFEKMEFLAAGDDLLPVNMRSHFEDAVKNGQIARLAKGVFDESGERAKLGPTPTVDSTLAIVREAAQCQEYQHTEHSWNCAVHFPLLCLALHGGHIRKNQLVDFDSCTHARPIKNYRHPSASYPSNMVDFSILLRPRNLEGKHGPSVQAINVLRRDLAGDSINHTDHYPFLSDPIAVSIETKRPEQGEQKQALQMGSWQAAQWRLLRHLVEKRLLAEWPRPDNTSHELALELEKQCDDVLAELGYLPALFVRGHVWAFVATTREGNKTILWREVHLGTTRALLDVYKIVYAIQLLSQYARDHFWPWYRRRVLGI